MKPIYLTVALLLLSILGYSQDDQYGCIDQNAINYDASAVFDNGSCCYSNYITTDAGTAVYSINISNTNSISVIYPDYMPGACVLEGCYSAYISPWNNWYTDITFYLNGEILASFTAAELQANNGTVSLSVGNIATGCTDFYACNYNPGANCDDGSCNYDCLGCTDPEAFNYDPSATTDDGSCCTAENSITLTHDVDGSVPSYFGVQSLSTGYYVELPSGSTACLSDGCYQLYHYVQGYGVPGISYNVTITNGNGEVLVSQETYNENPNIININVNSIVGCTDYNACNYNPQATCNANCDYSCQGCTDPTATNYDPNATIDNGSCCNATITIVGEGNFGWQISSTYTGVYYSGNYPGNNALCLADGCYYIYVYTFDNSTQTWEILDADGNIIINNETGSSGGYYYFGINEEVGCGDPNACNFNPNVTCASWLSCTYDCFGCTDPNAPNYNPEATVDNGTCCSGNWYTVETTDPGYWSAYAGDGSFGAAGHFPEDNSFCLPAGCYTFYYQPDNYTGESFTYSLFSNGDLLEEVVVDPLTSYPYINIDNDAVTGCTEPSACNFDPLANCPDYEACDYGCYGCTDPAAENYDPNATLNSGLCCYNQWFTVELSSPGYWSTSSLVDYNYGYGHYPEENGFCVDGECFSFYAWGDNGEILTYTIYDAEGNAIATGENEYALWSVMTTIAGDGYVVGCIDPNACNYNPSANCGDYISCDYGCYGCTDPNAPNYDPQATIDDNTCCTQSWYTVSMDGDAYWYAYNSGFYTTGGIYPLEAGFCANGECFAIYVYPLSFDPITYSIFDNEGTEIYTGIAYPNSYNLASIGVNGEIAGCLDPSACNYNPDATCDNYSCNFYCGGCTDSEALNYNPQAQFDDGSCFFEAVPPIMGMAMLPDEDNNQYYVVMSMMDEGNGAPYIMTSDFNSEMTMMNEAGQYVAGPYPCDADVEFTLHSLAAGLSTYMNTTLESECAITSDVNDINEFNTLTIYPNPNNGQFMITGINEANVRVRVTDMEGRVITDENKNAGSGQLNISLDNLSNGVYQVSVITSNNVFTERMVVKK